MANIFLTSPEIAKATITVMRNEGVLLNRVNRDFDKEFKGGTGDYCNVRKPVRYVLGDGADITNDIQNMSEKYTSVQITEHKHLAISPTRREMTLDIVEFSKLYLSTIGNEFAEHMDYTIAGLYDEVYFASGTPGTLPTAFADIAGVAKIMDKHAMPRRSRLMVMNEDQNWNMADALKGTFDAKLAKDTVRTGYLGTIANMDLFMDQNIRRHTSGTLTGSPVIDTVDSVTYITASAANTETSTLHTDGWTGTLTEGDIITVDGVYALNPANRQSTGVLQQFVVREAITGSTDSPLTVAPAIVVSGPYQNVSAAPADGATVTVVTQATSASGTATTSVQGLGFHPNAFTLACVPFAEVPGSQGVDSYTMNFEGLAITVTKGFDILTNRFILRFDLMYGVKAVNPAMACRWQS
jgi:hypothetical protein